MSDYPGLRMSGLLTDLYELTMAAGYVQKNIEARATFEHSFAISRRSATTSLQPDWKKPFI